MATLVQMSMKGATTAHYDQVNEAAGISNDNLPAGLISHAAWAEGDTIHVTDLWESQQQFEQFFGPVVPALEKIVGKPLTTPPTFTEVYNYFPKK